MKQNSLIYPKLSYKITGILFEVHNELGRYCREKQYCDNLEKQLEEQQFTYKREYTVCQTGNRTDFIVDDMIVIECKAKTTITKDDYYQLQRYLQATGHKLGLLVNFRSRYLKPIRVLRIDTPNKNKFLNQN